MGVVEIEPRTTGIPSRPIVNLPQALICHGRLTTYMHRIPLVRVSNSTTIDYYYLFPQCFLSVCKCILFKKRTFPSGFIASFPQLIGTAAYPSMTLNRPHVSFNYHPRSQNDRSLNLNYHSLNLKYHFQKRSCSINHTVCRSVGWSVGWLVGRSVDWLVGRSIGWSVRRGAVFFFGRILGIWRKLLIRSL